MTDRRLIPANARVAAAGLEGQVVAERFVTPVPRRVVRPVTDLLRAPDGPRERQLVYGEAFDVLETRDGVAFGQAARDGYVGYVPARALADPVEPTHMVSVPATHAYPAPDLKRQERMGLSFGSRLRVVSASGNFFETAEGLFVPKPHLRPVNRPFADPATVAQLHFGAPYLWGGNSIWGIDCSGLVQAALLSCGIACPGDSDLQQTALGAEIAPDTPPQRGDLFFWKGHVAMAVDGQTLIHSNAKAMAVAYEPIADTIARIEAQGEGPVTARRRL